MYARDLMTLLHERLCSLGTFDQTRKRFESLRGCNLLPRGRENAGVRLSNEQIANAVLGFAHPMPGMAGHASLILGELRPVGGSSVSFSGAPTLKAAVATLVGATNANSNLLRLTLSVERDFGGDEYAAVIYFRANSRAKAVSFVSKHAFSLLGHGADEGYEHERLNRLTAVQRSLSPRFFQDLSRHVAISRQLDRPFKTDWREYENEEEKADLYRRLGARPSSRFLNLRVDAQVTWPGEPTRIEFGGHHLVLFPRTKDNAHSISIDLHHERISEDEAQTLVNRLLSVMSWCDDQRASVHEGWSGSPVPTPMLRENSVFVSAHEWHFYRKLPHDDVLMRCLAFYRDGLNAYSAGLASHAVLSFFRVFETRYHKKEKAIRWVNAAFPKVEPSISAYELESFESDRRSADLDVGSYVYEKCRVAVAHAARDAPSDVDKAEESSRLLNASRIIRWLARHFIEQKFNFSSSYLSDDPA